MWIYLTLASSIKDITKMRDKFDVYLPYDFMWAHSMISFQVMIPSYQKTRVSKEMQQIHTLIKYWLMTSNLLTLRDPLLSAPSLIARSSCISSSWEVKSFWTWIMELCWLWREGWNYDYYSNFFSLL